MIDIVSNISGYFDRDFENIIYKDLRTNGLSDEEVEKILSDKYRDLFFSKREKKSNIKYVNFTSTDSFSELFTDINKNIKPGYICFATKDILYYKYYLNKIFDNIIVLNNAEL